MPQLEDAPKVTKSVTLLATDLVQVYDLSAQPNGAIPVTLTELFQGFLTTLPTSSAGLTLGQLYLNSGVLTRIMA